MDHLTINLEGEYAAVQMQTNEADLRPNAQSNKPNPILVDANVVHRDHLLSGFPLGSTSIEDVHDIKLGVVTGTTTDAMLEPLFSDTSNPSSPVSNKKKHHFDSDEEHQLLLLDSPGNDSHSSHPNTITALLLPPRKLQRTSRSSHRISWDERMQQLQDYKSIFGDLLIPIRFKENPSLGKFVHNTREQHKLFQKAPVPGKTKTCSLTAERIQQLEALGFVWSTERSKHQKEDWEARVKQLKAYKRINGDCLVPHGHSEDPSFAEWVHRQRTAHAHMLREDHPNPLVAERMKQLEDLDFHFTVHRDKWMDHWNELKEYNRVHGNCDCPTHCPENPKLGRWVNTQRHQRRLQLRGKKKSCMTEERVALLDSLGFSWELRHKFEQPCSTWQQQYDELKQFVDNHRHVCVPVDAMPHLHHWCAEQKRRLQSFYQQQPCDMDGSKMMTVVQVEALEAIGFTKDADIGPDNQTVANGEVIHESTHSEHLAHMEHNDHPGFGEALDAMIAVYDHSEDHGNPVENDSAEVASPNVVAPDCTLQAGSTKGNIFAPGMAMV